MSHKRPSVSAPLTVRSAKLVWLVAIVSGSIPATAYGVPEPFGAHYVGSKRIAFLTARAQATIQLRRQRDHLKYTIASVVRLAFYKRRFYDCAIVSITADGLRPVVYRHRDDADSSLNVTTIFDWDGRVARTQLGRDGEVRLQALEGPTWDPLSFQLALMARAISNPTHGVAHYQVIERGSLKHHEVHFAAPDSGDTDQTGLFNIISYKDESRIELDLLPAMRFEPQRLMIEGVSFSRTEQVVQPAEIADTGRLSCEDGESD